MPAGAAAAPVAAAAAAAAQNKGCRGADRACCHRANPDPRPAERAARREGSTRGGCGATAHLGCLEAANDYQGSCKRLAKLRRRSDPVGIRSKGPSRRVAEPTRIGGGTQDSQFCIFAAEASLNRLWHTLQLDLLQAASRSAAARLFAPSNGSGAPGTLRPAACVRWQGPLCSALLIPLCTAWPCSPAVHSD